MEKDVKYEKPKYDHKPQFWNGSDDPHIIFTCIPNFSFFEMFPFRFLKRLNKVVTPLTTAL